MTFNRWAAWFFSLLIVSVLIGIGLSGYSFFILAPFAAACFAIAGALQILTVAMFVQNSRTRPPRRSDVVVAWSFAVAAACTFGVVLHIPVVGGLHTDVALGTRVAAWLIFIMDVTFALSGLLYLALRRAANRDEPATRTFKVVSGVVALFALMVATVPPMLGGPMLPQLGIGRVPAVPGFPELAIATFCLLTTVAILAYRLPRVTAFDRNMAIHCGFLACAVMLDWFPVTRFSIPWLLDRTLLVASATVIFVVQIAKLISTRDRLREARTAMELLARHTRWQALRVRALSQLATADGMTDADHLQMIVDIGIEHLRPGRSTVGWITHLDGGEIVVDAVGASDPDRPRFGFRQVGARVPLAESGSLLLYAAGNTRAWIDVDHELSENNVFRTIGIRSLIGKPIQVGSVTTMIGFGCDDPLHDAPFDEADLAFVDVLASHISQRYFQRAQLERIRYQMEFDALTGLHNRTELRKAIRAAVKAGERFAVVFIDLDRFRHINEVSGHMIGDEILVEVGAKVRAVDAVDFVARAGGDIFAVLMPHIDDDLTARIAKYHEVFDTPFHTGDRNGEIFLSVGCSMGAAAFPDCAANADMLMQRVEVALEIAKGQGGGSVRIFDPAMESVVAGRQIERAEMVAGFERDEFVVEYQPTFETASYRVVGAEALIRWNHPTRGRLLPADFLPTADRSGLMTALSRYVFERVIRQIEFSKLPPNFRIFINVPARALTDVSFMLIAEQRLAAMGALTANVGVEVTESEAMLDVEATITALKTLRGHGVRVAIDDFGTGYSSMSYLKRLPVDLIKIDRSFITGLPDDAKDRAVTQTFLRLAKQLRFTCLAEGIETTAQAQWLARHGCQLGQGYLVSQSTSFEELRARFIAPEASHAS